MNLLEELDELAGNDGYTPILREVAREASKVIRLQALQPEPSEAYIEMLEAKCTAFARALGRLESNLRMTDAVNALQEMANVLKPLVDWTQATRAAVLDAGGCDYCEDRVPVVVTEEERGNLVHFDGGESADCENSVLQEMYRAGCLQVEVYARCEAGHDWFGSGCPECHPEEE